MASGTFQEEKRSNAQDKLEATLATSLAEVVGGSALHALHVPFSGYFLSLHQIAWQSWLLAQTKNPHDILECSVTTALIKPVAPLGKKLTPMLAIQAQGALHYAISLLSPNYIGNMMGCCFAALWGFIQPLLIFTFIFSPTALVATQKTSLDFLSQRIGLNTTIEVLYYLLLGIVAFKCLLAALIAHWTWRHPQSIKIKLLAIRKFLVQRSKSSTRNENELLHTPKTGAFAHLSKEVFSESDVGIHQPSGRSKIIYDLKIVLFRSAKMLKQPLFIIGLFITVLMLVIAEAELTTYAKTILRILGCVVIAQLILQIIPISQKKFPLLYLVRAELSRISKS